MMDCYKVIKIMFMSILNILGKYLLNNDKQDNEDAKLYYFSLNPVEERSENMAMSIPYLANKQVPIVKKADVASYGSTLEEFAANTKKCIFIVEKGSAGEELVAPVDEAE